MPKFDLNRVNDLYHFGRAYPHARPHDADYPKVKVSDYGEPDPRQYEVQDPEDRPASHDDVGRQWTNGFGPPHPHFDSGPSGNRYRK